MKILSFILAIFIPLTSHSQYKSDRGINHLYGVITDSISGEPVLSAEIVSQVSATVSDLDGTFIIEHKPDFADTLIVTAKGFEGRRIAVEPSKDSIIIRLKSIIDLESDFRIQEKAVDTLYYNNGRIYKIMFERNDALTFYKNGRRMYQRTGRNYRTWYKNGCLNFQSVLLSSHYRVETEWYRNGSIKAQGTTSWKHNPTVNIGQWFRNRDWKYWSKNGK